MILPHNGLYGFYKSNNYQFLNTQIWLSRSLPDRSTGGEIRIEVIKTEDKLFNSLKSKPETLTIEWTKEIPFVVRLKSSKIMVIRSIEQGLCLISVSQSVLALSAWIATTECSWQRLSVITWAPWSRQTSQQKCTAFTAFPKMKSRKAIAYSVAIFTRFFTKNMYICVWIVPIRLKTNRIVQR